LRRAGVEPLVFTGEVEAPVSISDCAVKVAVESLRQVVLGDGQEVLR
jgi:hypothetical protein